MSWAVVPFEELYASPSMNGVTRPVRVRGAGFKMINMGELFAHHRISNIEMERVQLNEKELSSMLVEPGDLLFARQSLVLAGAGKCSVVIDAEEPTTFESHLIRVRLKREIAEPLFFHYYFRAANSGIKSIVTQGVQAGIRGSDLKRLPVRVPPRPKQERIVEVLAAYDDLIENNQKRVTLLEEAARLLYREWFVLLRFPGHEHVKILDGVPDGWERLPASEAFSINPSTPRTDNGEITYVPMAALSEAGMLIDKGAFECRHESTSVRFQQGDTLFARITPCLENGKTGHVQFLSPGEAACGSTEFIVLRGRRVSNYFVYLTARQADFRENAIKSMIGSSGRQRVQTSCFDRYKVLVPPNHLAALFNETAASLFQQVRVLDQQSQRLAQARDLLLPRVMSGEIAV